MSNDSSWMIFEQLATESGAGSQEVAGSGPFAFMMIEPDDSSSFDLTLSIQSPSGTQHTLYSATGITANTLVSRGDLNITSLEVVANLKVTLANAGNHASAAKVYIATA